jgi:penicillin-binding protein 1C
VRLLELANAYAVLARPGVYKPFRLLAPGTPGSPGMPTTEEVGSQRIFDERAAYLLADMPSDSQARAGTFGLNSYLAFDFPVSRCAVYIYPLRFSFV